MSSYVDGPLLVAMRRIASLSIAATLTAAPSASSAGTSPLQLVKSITIPTPSVGVPDAAFSSFESAHVHPLDITPDGAKLLAVNTPNNDVEVFSINGDSLTLAHVIKVGFEPSSISRATR